MKRHGGFSGTALQCIAALSMTADHVGAVLLREMPYQWMLRAFGRLAFPIFAFLLSQGMEHTHSRGSFALRLAVFAVISELPFDIAFYGTAYYPKHQNVFWTLLIGALCIALCERAGDLPIFKCAAISLMAIAAQILRTDYGGVGMLTIVLFWLWHTEKAGTAVTALLFAMCMALGWVNGKGHPIYWCSLISLPLLLCYNGLRGGPSCKVNFIIRRWGFYLYYPAHLLVIAALAR